jgi:hypothetical protein
MKGLISMMVAMAVAAGLSAASPLAEQDAPRKLVAPVRGEVPIEVLSSTKIVGNEVISTIRVKNISKGAIAGFRVEENWYKGDNPVGGDSYRHPRPWQSGEIIEFELKTPRAAIVGARNQFQFTHANGTIKPTVVKTMDAPPKPAGEAAKPAAKPPAKPPVD